MSDLHETLIRFNESPFEGVEGSWTWVVHVWGSLGLN